MKKAFETQAHVSVLWHNTSYEKIDFPMWGKLYWEMIKHTKETNGWVCSMDEVYEAVMRNENDKIKND